MENLHARIEHKLLALPVPMALQLPDGKRLGPEDAAITLRVNEMSALVRLAAGQIGSLAEAIVEGTVQVQGHMRDLMSVVSGLLPGNPTDSDTHWWTQMMRRAKSVASHSKERDAAQIQFHYDVSDDFYALWLDPRRVYSCAYFRSPEMTISQAQEAKLDHICKKLDLKAGERFLDVGAGWGGLLLWAAENYGVEATGITLSHNQHSYVQQLIAERGLSGRVKIELRDYRELPDDQQFDKIASVGMFEHVGRANMPTYFGKLYRLLAPGGLLLNHGITSGGLSNAQLGAGMGDFIEKYIFPGGELMHVSHVLHELAGANLEMVDTENLRPHYARTLWAWSDALESRLGEAAAELARSGDAERAERTLRAYRLYLSGSAMSFEHGWISLHQILATRPDGKIDATALPGAQSVYPFRRDYIYQQARNSFHH
jgi:cyclopropane-fatty-acyl-phospholipid synthase